MTKHSPTDTLSVLPPLMRPAEAATFLRVSLSVFKELAADLPKVRISPRVVLYRLQDLDEYVRRKIEWPESWTSYRGSMLDGPTPPELQDDAEETEPDGGA